MTQHGKREEQRSSRRLHLKGGCESSDDGTAPLLGTINLKTSGLTCSGLETAQAPWSKSTTGCGHSRAMTHPRRLSPALRNPAQAKATDALDKLGTKEEQLPPRASRTSTVRSITDAAG